MRAARSTHHWGRPGFRSMTTGFGDVVPGVKVRGYAAKTFAGRPVQRQCRFPVAHSGLTRLRDALTQGPTERAPTVDQSFRFLDAGDRQQKDLAAGRERRRLAQRRSPAGVPIVNTRRPRSLSPHIFFVKPTRTRSSTFLHKMADRSSWPAPGPMDGLTGALLAWPTATPLTSSHRLPCDGPEVFHWSFG